MKNRESRDYLLFGFLVILLFAVCSSYAHAQPIEPQPAATRQEYTLEDLFKIALERAERIKISEEDLFISERDRDRAFSALLPKLSAFGGYTRYTEDKSMEGMVIQPLTSKSWGVRLDQSFSLSGKEFTALKISKENIEKSKYDLYAVKEEYFINLSAAFYDVLRAKKSLDIARSNVERLTKHRDASAIRLKVGEATKTVLLRAEAELSGAESDMIRAESNLASSKFVLARLAGISGDYELKENEGSAEIDDQYKQTMDSLKEKALSERAEMKSLGLQKKIAEGQVTYTKGSYWPSISIEGVYSRREDDPATVFLIKESAYGGLSLNFPFFEGGLRVAEVREAEARYRQAELLYEDRKKSINVEVENAYLDLATQKGVLEKFQTQVAYAEDNYKAVSKQFDYGVATSLDVMDANNLLVTSQRQLSDAKYNYQLSVLKLQRATGILLKTAMSQIK